MSVFRLSFQFPHQRPHRRVDIAVLIAQFLDLAHRVDDGRMVAPTELAPDLGQRARRQALRQIHGNLARAGDGAAAARRHQIERLQLEMLADELLDLVDRHAPLRPAQHVAQRRQREIQVDTVAGQLRIGDHAVQRAFQLADVGVDARGQQVEHLCGNLCLGQVCEFPVQYGTAQREVGRLDVGDEADRHAADDPRLDAVQRLRAPIGGDDEAAARPHDLVDRVEEFFLRRILARDELQVVDQQQVGAAQPLLEGVRVARPERADKIEHEALGRHAQHGRIRMLRQKRMADRVHQVRLALPRPRMEEQRAEPRHTRFGQRARRVERDAIGRIDDEAIEGEARIERRSLSTRCIAGDDGGGRLHERQHRGGLRRGGRRRLGNQLHRRGRHTRLDRHAAHAGQQRAEFQHQPVRIMIADPVGHEGGWQREADRIGITVLDQLHRLQPLFEQPRTGRFAQVAADARPGALRLALRHRRYLPIVQRTPLRYRKRRVSPQWL
ncbi:hypothetical protein WR25_02116 [Diploscapter pachys]|uniref:Uncharacterized protein n=1 Tax=Diploscapter pachys TaxID=2018661 RepID=A0A2A2JWT9_9BILA|nr:hypothetical protein WR25_02116 [Diploscapter pachys]